MKRIFIATLMAGSVLAGNAAQSVIKPGQVWNDTSGKHINAHGGCVQFLDGTYYWFGEDRTGYNSNGISCYTSTDLFNWKRVGLVFNASQAKDPTTGKCILERPKVVYNDLTKKWVMYIHWENGDGYGEARVCVATADKIDGSYTFISTFRPNNHDSRDQTIFKDTDGKAYHFGSTDMNTNINVCLLSDDYLQPETSPITETKILKGLRYEAPAIIKAGDVYFGVFSGCTGWDPNPGHSATSTEILGYWEPGANFAIDNDAATTYHSQSTYIFPVDGIEEAYVYMGDRWNSSDVGGKSEYVWLPLSLRSGAPTVKWRDSWDMSAFDNCGRFKRPARLEDGMVVRALDKYSDRWFSTKGNGFFIDDDNDNTNIDLVLEATENPYQWYIKRESDGKYFESIFGALMFNDKNDQKTQLWRLELEEDGCYIIQNVNDSKALSVSGGAQLAGTSMFMSAKGANPSQSFGLYFDTKKYNYDSADMFSADYRARNAAAIEAQKQYEAEAGVSEVLTGDFSAYFVDGSLHISTGREGVYEMTLYSISGHKMYGGALNLSEGENVIDMATEIVPGIYILTLNGKNNTLSVKVTVQ